MYCTCTVHVLYIYCTCTVHLLYMYHCYLHHIGTCMCTTYVHVSHYIHFTRTYVQDNYTISQLKLENRDQFTAEQNVKKGYKSFAHSVVDKQNKLITFLVENRCTVSNSACGQLYMYNVCNNC